MPRRRTPVWLTQPTRFAGLKRDQAWIGLAMLALLLLVCVSVSGASKAAPVASGGAIGRTIVDGVRHGGTYYAVAASTLRAAGHPLHPFLEVRLPTLAVIVGWLPPLIVAALFYALALAVMIAWFTRLHDGLRHGPATTIALVLLGAGMATLVGGDLLFSHDAWAGLLIALSLAVRRPERWIEPIAIGLIALLIRETALIYVILMAIFALLEGRGREAIGWAAAILLFGVVLALHAHAVDAVVGPLDPAAPDWGGMLGFDFFVRSLTQSTALAFAPLLVGALLIGLSLFGWAAWNDATGLRVLTIFVGYAALIGIVAHPGDAGMALIVAPLSLLGLVFVPDALGDIMRAALDKRRITVTRLRR